MAGQRKLNVIVQYRSTDSRKSKFLKSSMLREITGSGEHDGIKICRVRQVLEVLDAEQVGRRNKRAIEKTRRANLS